MSYCYTCGEGKECPNFGTEAKCVSWTPKYEIREDPNPLTRLPGPIPKKEEADVKTDSKTKTNTSL